MWWIHCTREWWDPGKLYAWAETIKKCNVESFPIKPGLNLIFLGNIEIIAQTNALFFHLKFANKYKCRHVCQFSGIPDF